LKRYLKNEHDKNPEACLKNNFQTHSPLPQDTGKIGKAGKAAGATTWPEASSAAARSRLGGAGGQEVLLLLRDSPEIWCYTVLKIRILFPTGDFYTYIYVKTTPCPISR